MASMESGRMPRYGRSLAKARQARSRFRTSSRASKEPRTVWLRYPQRRSLNSGANGRAEPDSGGMRSCALELGSFDRHVFTPAGVSHRRGLTKLGQQPIGTCSGWGEAVEMRGSGMDGSSPRPLAAEQAYAFVVED